MEQFAGAIRLIFLVVDLFREIEPRVDLYLLHIFFYKNTLFRTSKKHEEQTDSPIKSTALNWIDKDERQRDYKR